MRNNNVIVIENTLTTSGRGMTQKRRLLCQAFFLLDDPTDAESFWIHLKTAGIAVSRAQVYKTLSLLADYGFAERRRDDQKRVNYFKPV
ncbi:hypothetical protein [Mucilaginibacter sp. dw_454]|uniref:hypothetical protein n=1 Tax=Mucilaginibacter sp. dw_454 TaxID=2720079 RepID=UPI001BD5BC91|nr:hypothetical protein [Mucilaginibacter sp. dw_454]